MSVEAGSTIFDRVRGPAVEGGLTQAQLEEIVGYIASSPIFSRRIGSFEAAGGRIEYEKAGTNYFWEEDRVPFVYVAASYGNVGDAAADIQSITQVLAHEMSHFETYFPRGAGINPNAAPDENHAGVQGVADEARAYALEYLVQREIAAAHPDVDWMKRNQLASVTAGLATVADDAGEIEQLDAATLSMLDWSANWTNDESAGGYFQFYQNAWLKENARGRSIVSRDVSVRCSERGDIVEVAFDDAQLGRRIAVIDPPIRRFVPRSA